MSILTTILFWVGILGCIAFLFFAFDSQEIVFFGISILFGLLILGSCIAIIIFHTVQIATIISQYIRNMIIVHNAELN